jgi:cell division protein FtsL
MKAPTARHERTGSQSTICVICLLGVLISAMSLGSMRLYGLYLEHRLADVTMRIESINNKNAALEERYSSLLSPSRIYNYARVELNMVTAKEIETIKLNRDDESSAALAGLKGTDAELAAAPSGIARLFTGIANAKD